MALRFSSLLRAGLFSSACVLLTCVPLRPQDTTSHWEAVTAAAGKAYQDRNFAEAEKLFTAALHEAESLHSPDYRLAASLNNLAELLRHRGRYSEAEPLFQRSVEIWEKVRGPQDVAA